MGLTDIAATKTTVHYRFPWQTLAFVLTLAVVGRALLLASGRVSFHSDEAVIGLMARHILDGARPTFFYGQAYMGSLDAWLVAVGFRLLGESVLTIRIVQAALYLGVVTVGFCAAWRLSRRPVIALVAGLTLAVPPVLLTVYTSATLGGYNETLLFGGLLILLGYDITHEHAGSWWRWLLIGVVGGLAWWTNGLVIAFAAPVALMIAYRFFRPSVDDTSERARFIVPLPTRFGLLVLAVVGFFIGSAPWWIFNLNNDWAALAFYVARTDEGQFAGNSVPSLPPEQRIIGLIFLGLPTLIGLRFPWHPTFFAPLVGSLVVFIYGVAIYRLVRRPSPLLPDARALVLGMIALFCVLFFVSKFSIDPTGRYFLPLVFPFGVVLGTLIDTLAPSRLPRLPVQVGIVVLVLVYFAAGQITVAADPSQPGFTTQFNLDSHIPNDYDDELIAWLDEHGIDRGYSTYWVTFRLAFLSQERMQFSSALPYKPSLSYTEADERYPAYKAAADASDQVAYITANVPAVQQALEAVFAADDIAYDTATVGPFHIYYAFEPRIPRPPLPLGEYDITAGKDSS